MFNHVINTVPSLRVLLIVTFRPEFEPPWVGRPHVTALTLNRLAEREVGAMIDGVIGNKLDCAVKLVCVGEVLEGREGVGLGRIDHRSRQQLLCNYRSACGEDGAFEDDGEAGTWFEPLDRREQECGDEDDHQDIKGG